MSYKYFICYSDGQIFGRSICYTKRKIEDADALNEIEELIQKTSKLENRPIIINYQIMEEINKNETIL